ncbi:MAG: PDZ domain-containing protein [Planctomycetales bacterium]|nr:PDZ domain-containing protein [Planctomycetales bacterium]
MKCLLRTTGSTLAVVFAAAACFAADPPDAAQPEGEGPIQFKIELNGQDLNLGDLPVDLDLGKLLQFAEGKEEQPDVRLFGGAEVLVPSSHWIGVAVRPVEESYQKQLKIDGGLLVDLVTPDSPAAKAQLATGDILLTFNDAKLESMQGLMNLLTENKDKPAKLSILRAGKKKSLDIAPQPRPAEHAQLFAPLEGAIGAPKELQALLEKNWKDADGHGDKEGWHWQFVHPGIVIGADAHAEVIEAGDDDDLPDDLVVVVVKQDDGPAKIQVRSGDKSWNVAEDQLDKLPENVRDLVKKYLAKAQARKGARLELPAGPRWRPLEAPAVHALQLRGDGQVEKQLKDVQGRLERIEGLLKQLTEKQ